MVIDWSPVSRLHLVSTSFFSFIAGWQPIPRDPKDIIGAAAMLVVQP